MHTKTIAGIAVLAIALGASLALTCHEPASASDHTDSPLTDSDPAADLADVYAFHDAGRLVAILTYGSGGTLPLYDAEVLYTLHVDTNGDNASEHQIHVRFGPNTAGQWGVQALNVPGVGGALTGAVQTTITASNGSKLFAGIVDDPFFFDAQGFQDTLATSTLSFNNARDGFAGLNVMAIVVEVPLADVSPGLAPMGLWATTGRE